MILNLNKNDFCIETETMSEARIINGKEGESVTIECSLKGSDFQHTDHRITFEWFKGKEPILFGSRIKLITRNKLKITSLQRSDRGLYHVIVR